MHVLSENSAYRWSCCLLQTLPRKCSSRLDGQMTREMQAHNLSSFRSNSGNTVFLIFLKAGGTGLNLPCASSVVLVRPCCWSGAAHLVGTSESLTVPSVPDTLGVSRPLTSICVSQAVCMLDLWQSRQPDQAPDRHGSTRRWTLTGTWLLRSRPSRARTAGARRKWCTCTSYSCRVRPLEPPARVCQDDGLLVAPWQSAGGARLQDLLEGSLDEA